MKWLKIEEKFALDEPLQDDEPTDYIIDAESIAQEEDEPSERKGVFHGLTKVLKSIVSGDKVGEEAEQEYVAAVDESRIVIHTDKLFNITYLNEAGRNMFGMTDAGIGKSIMGSIISTGEESKNLLEKMKHALFQENERFQSIVVRAYNRSSNIIWLNFSVEALRDEQCGLIGIMWNGRDITDSVLMSYEGSPTDDKTFRNTIESVPSPIMVVGMGRVIMAWNRRFLDIWGLDPDNDIITPETLLSIILLNVKDHHKFVERVIRLVPGEDDGPLIIDLKDGHKFICHNKSSDIEGYKDCTVWAFQPTFSQGRWMENEGSEQRPDLHMDDIPDLLWEIDPKNKILYASRSLEKMLGHRIDDMIGYDLFNFVHPEEHTRLRAALSKANNDVQHVEIRMIRGNGGLVWLQLNCKKLPEKNELPTGHLIAGLDISERKMSDRSLMDLSHVFRSLMQHTRDGIWLMDESGVVIQWNHSMELITGINDDNAIGRALPDLETTCLGFADIYQKMASRLNQKDMLILNNHLDTVLTTRAGVSIAASIEVHRISTDKGHLVMGICSPINGRTSEGSVEPVDHYQRMVENSPDMVLNLDSQLRLTYCNRSVQRLLGKKWEDVVGKPIYELFPMWPHNDHMNLDPNYSTSFDMEVRDVEGKAHIYRIIALTALKDKNISQYHGAEVTEQVNMHRHLLASEDLVRKLLEAYPDPAFIANVNGTVDMANDALSHIFDVELGKDNWLDMLTDFDKDSGRDLLPNVRKKGRCQEHALHFEGKDCTQYVASVDVEPVLGSDGVLTGFLLILKRLSQNGHASPEPMLGMDAGPIEETFNEPLGGIGTANASAFLVQSAASERPVVNIASKGRHDQLTESYSLIGRSAPSWFSLQEMCQAAAQDRGDDLDSLGEIDQVEVYADPLVLQVLGKLIDNALEHGGNVNKVDIKFFVGDKGAYIVVEDDGRGVEDRRKEEIFEYSYEGRNGHDLHFIREVLAVTDLQIAEVGEYGKGARFEMFLPQDKHRKPQRKTGSIL